MVIFAIAIVSKVGGCGIPAAIMLKSRKRGFRIGFGVIPRVVFIVAGIGLAFEVISDEIYSTIVLVILATIFIAPILIRYPFESNS